jgi:FMN phosphatase YigB (HAD superfamily)
MLTDLQTTLPLLIPRLLKQFSSSLGYTTPPDVLPALRELRKLSPVVELGVVSNTDTAMLGVLRDLEIVPELVSPDRQVPASANSDASRRGNKRRLNAPLVVFRVSMSWAVGFAKPDRRIFEAAVKAFGSPISPDEVLHVGDEIDELGNLRFTSPSVRISLTRHPQNPRDYLAAKEAGLHALLLRRRPDVQPHAFQPGTAKGRDESLRSTDGVEAVSSLEEVVEWIRDYNRSDSRP